MAKKLDIVTLKDEHKQKIVIVPLSKGKFAWHFLAEFETTDYPSPQGRYGSRAKAIASAQEFCNECAA